MQIPFIGDIEDDSITNQEETPTGHAAARFQRGYHFLLLNPMRLFSGILQSQGHREADGEVLSVPGRIVTFSSKSGFLGL
jgi:hypothetical protein